MILRKLFYNDRDLYKIGRFSGLDWFSRFEVKFERDRYAYFAELFLELYNYGLKRLDRDLQPIADSLLSRQGFQFHLVIVGTYNNRFVKRYNIDTPVLSLGITFIIPIGVVLFHENFKRASKEWIRFAIAHELGHICLNHFPINVFVSEVWRSLPQDLREFWVGLKWFIYVLSTISSQPHKIFLEEEITAQKELMADEWAVRF